MNSRWIAVLALVLLALPAALAHESDARLAERISGSALAVIGITAGIVALATIVSLSIQKSSSPAAKWVLFLAISIPVLIATFYSAGSTIYLNLGSETKGPVHWHTDFEIWHCGTLVDLKDPTGLLNRIGTPTLHEHNENRIHVEGVLVHKTDAALAEFFNVIGGAISLRSLTVPTNEGVLKMATGDPCPGSETGNALQVFRISTEDGQMRQQKLPFFMDYTPAPHSGVPPGDCLIIEFGPDRPQTDHVCASYRAAISRGDLRGG